MYYCSNLGNGNTKKKLFIMLYKGRNKDFLLSALTV